MSLFCNHCGEPISDGKKFCTSCGTQIDGEPVLAAVTASPAVQTSSAGSAAQPTPAGPAYAAQQSPQLSYRQAEEVPPPKGSRYAVMSTFGYIGWCILMGLPIVGLVITIVLAFGKGPVNRRNLARAVLIFTGIGIVFTIFSVVTLWPIIKELATFTIDL